MPRSPQGHPVIMQAGQSGRGMAFAARWGELIFGSVKAPEAGRITYRTLKDAVSNAGRNPDQVKFAPNIYAIVGETRGTAEEKRAFIESLSAPEDSLTLIAEVTNYDYRRVGIDEPIPDAEMAKIGVNLGLKARVVQLSGTPNPTPRDFITHSRRGTINESPVFCGTAADVADRLEDWFRTEVCDGFVLSATHRPGAYEDFSRLVVPELQRRGLFHADYARGHAAREPGPGTADGTRLAHAGAGGRVKQEPGVAQQPEVTRAGPPAQAAPTEAEGAGRVRARARSRRRSGGCRRSRQGALARRARHRARGP